MEISAVAITYQFSAILPLPQARTGTFLPAVIWIDPVADGVWIGRVVFDVIPLGTKVRDDLLVLHIPERMAFLSEQILDQPDWVFFEGFLLLVRWLDRYADDFFDSYFAVFVCYPAANFFYATFDGIDPYHTSISFVSTRRTYSQIAFVNVDWPL